MGKLKAGIDYVLSVICELMFAFMTVLAVYQVITRYIFNKPSSFSEELLTYCFAWMSMLAATLVFGERDHMRLGFFADKLKGKKSVWLSIVSELLILIFAALIIVYGGIAIVSLTLKQVTASLSIPMGYVYSIMAVCGVLTVIYCVIHIADFCSSLKDERSSL